MALCVTNKSQEPRRIAYSSIQSLLSLLLLNCQGNYSFPLICRSVSFLELSFPLPIEDHLSTIGAHFTFPIKMLIIPFQAKMLSKPFLDRCSFLPFLERCSFFTFPGQMLIFTFPGQMLIFTPPGQMLIFTFPLQRLPFLDRCSFYLS